MEVHHPQVTHHKKKWTGYLLEFFMLFLAIFLGFVAENIRENAHNKDLEKAYLKAIVKDLQADSAKTSLVIHYAKVGEKNIITLSHLLYEFHNRKITQEAFFKDIISHSDSVYNNWTIFINNASYKNMLASGRLNNLHNADLRLKMANYYESMAKQIDVQNAIIDNVTLDYYKNYFPLYVASVTRDQLSKNFFLENKNENGRIGQTRIPDSLFMDRRNYLAYFAGLSSVKAKLLSDDLVWRTEYLYVWILQYGAICTDFKDANTELLAEIRNYNK